MTVVICFVSESKIIISGENRDNVFFQVSPPPQDHQQIAALGFLIVLSSFGFQHTMHDS